MLDQMSNIYARCDRPLLVCDRPTVFCQGTKKADIAN